jgi:tetratricopeptide (TPR) repeat protein
LDAAHQAGVLHRDLKSNNVMLALGENAETCVYVMDFGLACERDSSRSDLSRLTEGALVGTPEYMAPEQMQGLKATIASDVYSLGVVLYEMATGELPISGPRALTVILKRLQEDVPAPRDVRPDLPKHWNATILACLDRDTARRPETPLRVMELLEGKSKVPNRAFASRRGWIISSFVSVTAAAGGVAWVYGGRRSISSEALLSYKRGESLSSGRRTEDELKEAIKEFRHATEIQPDYAAAWCGLASAYAAAVNFGFINAREGNPKAFDAAQRAIKLDGRYATAHGVYGYLISNDLRRWRSAGSELELALGLDGKDPQVRLWNASFLGKLNEGAKAIEQLKAGLQTDPSNMPLMQQLAIEYMRTRQYELCYQQAKELRRLNQTAAASHLMITRATALLGRFDEALAALADAVRFDLPVPIGDSIRSIILVQQNRLGPARHLAAQVESYWNNHPFVVTYVVCPFAQLGEFEKVMAILRECVERENDGVLSVHREPWMDPIRNYGPYLNFCRQIGVDPAATPSQGAR